MIESIVANDKPKPKKKPEFDPEKSEEEVQKMPVGDNLKEKLKQIAIETALNNPNDVGS